MVPFEPRTCEFQDESLSNQAIAFMVKPSFVYREPWLSSDSNSYFRLISVPIRLNFLRSDSLHTEMDVGIPFHVGLILMTQETQKLRDFFLSQWSDYAGIGWIFRHHILVSLVCQALCDNGYSEMQRMEHKHKMHPSAKENAIDFHNLGVMYKGLLRACIKKKDLKSGIRLHSDILRLGLLDKISRLGNNLISMYAKCGMPAKARNVLMQLAFRDVVSWNALISGYVRESQNEEAFNCFREMRRECISPDAITFTYILKSCDTLDKGEQIHEEIVKRNLLGKDIVLDTAVVDMYTRCGELEKAQMALEHLPVRDIILWSTLMSGFVRQGQDEKALHCLDQMQNEGFSPNCIIFTIALQACGAIQAIVKGKRIHSGIVPNRFLEIDVVLGSALVDMYAQCGALVNAQETLNELPVRDEISWNILISGYERKGYADDVFSCYERMLNDGTSPNEVSFFCILKACGTRGVLGKGKHVHNVISYVGKSGGSIMIQTALVDMYVKCAAVSRAQRVFDELPVRDTVSWSALIAGYVQQGQGQNAMKCFEQMQIEKLSPNQVTFTCVLKACGDLGLIDKGKRIHQEIISKGLVGRDVVLGNALVEMYAKCHCMFEAQQVFDGLPIRDAITWSALISGYMEQGQVENALNCIDGMKSEGVDPDLITSACILKACASVGAFGKGKEMHHDLARKGLLGKDIALDTAIVDMYAKCGSIKAAQQFHCDIPVQDEFSWSALITGYAQCGQAEKALSCLEHMRNQGLYPNQVTYLSLLNGFSHSGLVEQGEILFLKMVKEYKVIPELEHYICVIDLLARAGKFDEARGMVRKMPCSDCFVAWGVLTGACHYRSNVVYQPTCNHL